MTTLGHPLAARVADLERRLVETTGERDAARELFVVLEEWTEKALRLHQRISPPRGSRIEPDYCSEDNTDWPCETVVALTGADEDGAA